MRTCYLCLGVPDRRTAYLVQLKLTAVTEASHGMVCRAADAVVVCQACADALDLTPSGLRQHVHRVHKARSLKVA